MSLGWRPRFLPAWSPTWPSIETEFAYTSTSPFLLERVRLPSRQFVDDQDRSGTYSSAETYTGQVVTSFAYATGGNRISSVYDESAGGLARQMLKVDYDTSPSWRVTTLTEGVLLDVAGARSADPQPGIPNFPRASDRLDGCSWCCAHLHLRRDIRSLPSSVAGDKHPRGLWHERSAPHVRS